MSAYLSQLTKKGAVPATLLLYGPDHSALKTSALTLLPETSLDLHTLTPESKNGLHTQSSIEALIREVALPPFEAPFKLFIIEEAEKMLPSASNALLKTLEEPPEDTYIALLSTRPAHLLPTIRSRCHAIEITAPQKSDPSPDRFHELCALAKNRDYPSLLKALEGDLPDIQLETPAQLSAERTYRLALERNIKPRNALLNFLLTTNRA